MLHWGQDNNGESCNMLQSGLDVAKFLLHSVVACSTWVLCCRGRTLPTKPQTGVYKPDVMAPNACQNNRSYVIYMYLWITMHGGRHWAVTQRTLKNHIAVKIGVWVLACPGQYGIQESIVSYYWQVYFNLHTRWEERTFMAVVVCALWTERWL